MGRQTDSPRHSGAESRTEAVGVRAAPRQGWPRYLVPSPVSSDGGGSRVTVALGLQLPEEPARLRGVRARGARGGETQTQIQSERERGRREAGEKDGRRGEEMSLVLPWGMWRPRPLPLRTPCPTAHAGGDLQPRSAQPSPSNPVRTPG